MRSILKILVVPALAAAISAGPAEAAPILLSGLESQYTPGEPQTVNVTLPAIADLGSYNVDLVLTSDTGVAGTDFFFDAAATGPAAGNYVFPSSANFFDAANLDAARTQRLTLTDFDFSGVDVIPGVNDQVATVTINTRPGFFGTLSLSVDSAGLILDTPDASPTPVASFSAVQSATGQQASASTVAIPEPASVAVLALLPVLIPLLRRRLVGAD